MKKHIKKLGNIGMLIFFLLVVNSCELTDDLPGVNQTVIELEGEWDVDENSDFYKSTKSTYNVTISADPDNSNGIIIDNFYDVGISVRADVSGKSLIISNQNAEDGYSLHGSGSITNNNREINLSYVIMDESGQEDHVTAVYTKP